MSVLKDCKLCERDLVTGMECAFSTFRIAGQTVAVCGDCCRVIARLSPFSPRSE